ncbi:DUF7311 family protein [Halorubrum sp. DTA46]|uniref:DUF7311 family protein n=1 Tax=Halorubrum sp. DTA46 TaxID=3402162 RepID=UPI003AAF8130
MIRVVLTVLVAVALLAASMPALESARTATTAEQLDAEADRVERAIAGVVSGSVAVRDRALAARTTATVRAPRGVTAARIDRLALADSDRGGEEEFVDEGGEPGDGVVLRYRIDGGPERSVSVVPRTLGASVDVDGGPLELRTSGESRVAFRFVDDGDPTVKIARVG